MRVQTVAAVISITGLMVGGLGPAPTQAQNGSSAPKKPGQNEIKAQAQASGLYAQFGTTYTLKNKFNFAMLKARYTLEPFATYEILSADPNTKLVLIDLAIKNADKEDQTFGMDGVMTLVDAKGQLYKTRSGSIALKSMGRKAPNMTLKPGQGMGQPGLKDPLQIGFIVPANARIVKIILNVGRLGKNEEVLRYNVAGATQEEAGAPGDPLNSIAPLPDNVRDPADKSGAVALALGKGKPGEYETSGFYNLRLDDLAVSTDKFNGEAPPDGKKYVVATVSAKFIMDNGDPAHMGTVTGGDQPLDLLTDSDNEQYKPVGFRKLKADEQPEHTFMPNDEYKFRIFFVVPKDVTLKTLTLAAGNATKWGYDASGVK